VKLLLLTLFLAGTIHAFSQSDLLVLKQKNRIIQTWVPGSIINFQYSSKQWLMGIIKTVRNDSILMEQISIETVPNQFGFPRIDTAKFGLMKLHVSEIYGMPKKDYAGIFTNGTLLKWGAEDIFFKPCQYIDQRRSIIQFCECYEAWCCRRCFFIGNDHGTES
jgi:hypothetical protein